MYDDLLYLSCCFMVVRFDLRQTAPIFGVRIEVVVVLADVNESLCAESGGVESKICRGYLNCAFCGD